MDNEVMELIDQLYTMVSEAWGVPLGNEKCIVERDQVLEILDEIKTAMPVELARSNEMLASTQAKADALRRASSQFCDEALRRTEEAISAALGNVQQAHAAFQGVAGSTAAPAAAAPAAQQPEIRFEGEETPDEENN